MEQGMEQSMGLGDRRKIWLSYPLWVLYTLLVGICIAAGVWQAGKPGGYLAGAAAVAGLAGAAGIWFAGRLAVLFFKRKYRDKESRKKESRKRKDGSGFFTGRLECLAVIVLCGAAFCLRLFLFFSMDDVPMDAVTAGGAFYEAALVKEGGGVPWNAHGISYLYTVCLSFVLSFFGNKVTAGIALQMVLQVMSLPFFYGAVKQFAGRGEAFCALAVLVFVPGFYTGMYSLTPEPLSGLLFAFGLFLCGRYAKGAGKGAGGRKAYRLPVFCGLFTGFAGWLDPVGWLLLLPVLFSLVRTCGGDGAAEGGSEAEGRKGTVLLFAAYLTASLFSFLVFLWVSGIFAREAGQTYAEALSAWHRAVFGGLSVPSAAGIWSYLTEHAFEPVVYLCAALAVAGFWGRKGQKQDVWVTVLLLLYVFPVFGIGGMEYGMLRIMVWGILAGIGICSMGTGASGDGKEDEPVPAGTSKEDAAEDKPGVKFIENPLPLPKKHVKREMTYAKEVKGAEMDFDVSVAEDDDFDI